MLETSARLLRLLSLFQSRRYWPGADLAARLDVTTRTLRRDVDKLRTLGYPIHSTSGLEGGYQLGNGSEMPPLLLEDDEAVAVAIALRSLAASGAVSGMEQASVGALAKMEQLLPKRLNRRVEALHSMVVMAVGQPSSVSAKVLSSVAAACRQNELLHFRYRSHDGTATTRDVEPYRLVYTGTHWYLLAWDSVREDWRTFRVDRIEDRLTAGRRFTPRELPAKDIAAYVKRRVWNAAPNHASIKLHAAASDVASNIPQYLGKLVPIDSRTCMFEVNTASFEHLAMHLGWLGVDFEVTAPPELVKHVRAVAARYRKATPAKG